MELDLLSDNDLDETENVFIPNKILAHQFRDCIEDDYDFITDDEINIDDIYEMNYDIIIKNFQNNISNDHDNIDNNIFSDNNTLNKTNQNSDNISKFVSLNEKNFSIDHIIKNTYGRSENLNMLTQTNELSELLIEEENNENNMNILNSSSENNVPPENASSRCIGINICRNPPILFAMDNSGIEEDSFGYLNHLFGGYRYHLYKTGQSIKDYELIHLVFTIVLRIFRSAG
uniref:DDE_Tnp_1_7 domain-containing protein n=1 Tax=Strongyloides venezuelensis TaxID=75913 RepID=A0A0K0G3A9_STRVS